jgi:hypothetical protein
VGGDGTERATAAPGDLRGWGWKLGRMGMQAREKFLRAALGFGGDMEAELSKRAQGGWRIGRMGKVIPTGRTYSLACVCKKDLIRYTSSNVDYFVSFIKDR